jgi:hypothetical protein
MATRSPEPSEARMIFAPTEVAEQWHRGKPSVVIL